MPMIVKLRASYIKDLNEEENIVINFKKSEKNWEVNLFSCM